MYPQAPLEQSAFSSFLTNSVGLHTSMHVLVIWLIQQLQKNPSEILLVEQVLELVRNTIRTSVLMLVKVYV